MAAVLKPDIPWISIHVPVPFCRLLATQNSCTYVRIRSIYGTHIIWILGPSAYGHAILENVNVDKSRFPEPFFEVWAWPGRIPCVLKRIDEFNEVSL
jgi:hypothetical protein